jgi:hypothetical protein
MPMDSIQFLSAAGERHRWRGMVEEVEGYVRQSAAAAGSGRGRQRRAAKAAAAVGRLGIFYSSSYFVSGIGKSI